MGSPGGWSVYPATLNIPQQGSGGDLKQLGQVRKATESDYEDKQAAKEKAKDENEGMLYADKLYYLQGQSAISKQEKAVKAEMFNYYYNNDQAPSAEIQAGWNKQLSDVENSKIQMQAQESSLKDRRTEFNALRTAMRAGDDKATSNRIAVIQDNGVYTAVVGQKSTGGVGWLDQNELLDANQGSLGIGENGVPHGIVFPTTTGYTGSFNNYFDKFAKGGSQVLRRNPDGSVSTNAGEISGDEVTYMERLTNATDETQVYQAANAMWSTMPETAKADLMSKFHENMVRGKEYKDGSFEMPLAHADGKEGLILGKEEGSVMRAYMSGAKLTAAQRNQLGNIQEKYARQMIYSMVPGAIKTTENLTHVKTSGDANGGGTKGHYTMIGLDEKPATGKASIVYKKDNVFTEGAGVDNNNGSTRLRQWSDPNPTNVTKFNEDALNYLRDEGGMKPWAYSGNFNFFYSAKGVPQNMSILKNNNASIIGLTGRVQENYIPEAKNGPNGPEYDVPDVTKATERELMGKTIKTVEMNIVIPDAMWGDFTEQYKELTGITLGEPGDADFVDAQYYDETGNKAKGKFHSGTIWMPAENSMIPSLDDPARFGKGTAKALAKIEKDKRDAEAARMNALKVATKTNN